MSHHTKDKGDLIVRMYDEDDNTGERMLVMESTSEYYAFPDYIVDAITKREGEKKEDYWARVKANPLALRVKLADIAHNSSEGRLAALSDDERQYLRTKYAKALAFLQS